MTGTLINVDAVLVGGSVGLALDWRLPERLRTANFLPALLNGSSIGVGGGLVCGAVATEMEWM